MKHKNLILIVISVVLLIYAGFISIYPKLLTSTFNVDKFEQKVYDSTSLITTIGSINFKITPGLDMIITIRNWSSKYIDYQDLFDASMIQLTTSPFCVFTKKYNIKDLYLKNVTYVDQLLPTGENKLNFLPRAFDAKKFGTKNITIIPGPVRVKSFKIKWVTPSDYDEEYKRDAKYNERQVRDFLKNYQYSSVLIK